MFARPPGLDGLPAEINNVCFGQDSINDPWCPVGNGNMMNIPDNGIHLARTP